MIVVADTTPLNYLLLIAHVDLLPAVFERVAIPLAVFAESSLSSALSAFSAKERAGTS